MGRGEGGASCDNDQMDWEHGFLIGVVALSNQNKAHAGHRTNSVFFFGVCVYCLTRSWMPSRSRRGSWARRRASWWTALLVSRHWWTRASSACLRSAQDIAMTNVFAQYILMAAERSRTDIFLATWEGGTRCPELLFLRPRRPNAPLTYMVGSAETRAR